MSETLLNGRYRLVAQQGSGGMAVIYKAVDQELGRTVAVKILRPSLTKDPEFLERFKNEARSVANLNHPNIVTVYDVGNDQSTNYIVMEFIDGSDLKKLIRDEGALPVDQAVDLVIQICAGIGLAHRAGLVHADVKPQNVLLTSTRQIKVTDFGIAQALSETTTEERQAVVWGSPHYFAPEQARGERPSPASDVYSIGIVLFELLTGRLPYTGTSQQELALAHIRDEVPYVTEFAPHVPEELSRIVHKVMSKEPSQRYRMADQLGQVLAAYRQRGQQHTAPNPRVMLQSQMPPAPSVPAPDAQFQRPQGQQPPQQQQPNEPRPLYREPPKPTPAPTGNQEPTMRYNIVPDAPPPPPPNQQTPQPMQGGYGHGDTSRGMPPQSSQPLATGRYDAGEVSRGGLDAITIVLAFFAVMAVACLFPLYYVVWLAYR